MGQEGPSFEIEQDANEKEVELRRTPDILAKVDSHPTLTDAEKAEYREKIAEAEKNLKQELTELYAQLKDTDPSAYSKAEYGVAKVALLEKQEEQDQEGRGYRGVEKACRDAWDRVKLSIGTAGISVIGISEVMMWANSPSLNMDPLEYMRTAQQGGEWAGTSVEGGGVTLVALAIGYCLSRLHKRIADNARWKEIQDAQSAALKERGMR